MKLNCPLLKCIGDREMVIPLTAQGKLLSHQAFMNYYYPETICLIDSSGIRYEYQEVRLTDRINWWQSLRYLNVLHYVEPLLTQAPIQLGLDEMKAGIIPFVHKTPASKGISQAEKYEIARRVEAAASYREIIEVIASVSYWR
jgi:hypothetical protein